jgi:hypothetical protein
VTEQEFRRAVETRVMTGAQGIERGALDIAIAYCVRNDLRHTKGDVLRCLDLARTLRNTVSDGHRAAPAFGASTIIGRDRAGALKPKVENLRTEIFGSSKAPFRTFAAAQRWFEDPRHAQRDQLLFHLVGESQQIAKATGFGAQNVLLHVVTGAPLVFLPVRVTIGETGPDLLLDELKGKTTYASARAPKKTGPVEDDSPIRRRIATVEFLCPEDVSFEMLRRIHRQIRERLGLKHTKRLDARHELILRLVDEKSGPPRSARARFWEVVRCEYNNRRGRKWPAIQTGNGTRLLYKRATKATARLFGSEGSFSSASVSF